MPPTPEIPDLLAELRWRGLIHQCTDEKALHSHLNPGAGPSNPGAGPGALPAGGRRIYAGFDPTADSLTIGNLVPIMLLRHAQRAGHTPVVVMGGGTGLIGDPSGKSAERELMTAERVAANVESQKRIFGRILKFDPGIPTGAGIVNNLDWLGDFKLLDFLREVGKQFSIKQMLQNDSVRERFLNREQGISFTEFAYQLLQAYDFQFLCERHGVTVQFGGSDQWGNIVAGVDFARRAVLFICTEEVARRSGAFLGDAFSDRFKGLSLQWPEIELHVQQAADDVRGRMGKLYGDRPIDELTWKLTQDPARDEQLWNWIVSALDRPEFAAIFGLTAPLVTKSDGGKFGKTESGAVWLTAERTSPYAYYQFWLNADDRDVERFLKIFTLHTEPEIAALMAQHAADPGARHAHRALAQAATTLLHGEAETRKAEAAAKALFSGDVATLDLATLNDAFASAPTTTHKKSELSAAAVAPVASAPGSDDPASGKPGKSLVDLLVETNLAKSKREAREFLQNGSIALNGAKAGPEDRLTTDRLLHGSVALLRRGKKQWHVTRWE